MTALLGAFPYPLPRPPGEASVPRVDVQMHACHMAHLRPWSKLDCAKGSPAHTYLSPQSSEWRTHAVT